MAKSENQKVKTLFVAKYFLENSDENHPITAGDIVDYLREECGIEAERRAIYRDIAALRDVYGMDIAGGQGGKYRLLSRLNLKICDCWPSASMRPSLYPHPRPRSLCRPSASFAVSTRRKSCKEKCSFVTA